MKELLDYLKKELGNFVSKVKVENVRIGLAYTAVVLSTRHAGVAYTPTTGLPECPVLVDAGKISGKSALNVMNKVELSNLVETAVGVATINALSQAAFEAKPEKYVFSDIDVLDLIQPKDKVVMVGYFGPLIHKILRKTRDLYVLEKRKIKDKRVHLIFQHDASTVLPSSDILLISGSTLVNKTINQILKLRGNSREVVLLGPTASMVPQPLFKKGVTAVMGVKITDAEKMLRVVSESGGTRQLLSTCAKKTAFVRKVIEWKSS
jgi:uncharacterized protein (DUF4213/DUF364 family)